MTYVIQSEVPCPVCKSDLKLICNEDDTIKATQCSHAFLDWDHATFEEVTEGLLQIAEFEKGYKKEVDTILKGKVNENL